MNSRIDRPIVRARKRRAASHCTFGSYANFQLASLQLESAARLGDADGGIAYDFDNQKAIWWR